MTPCLPLLLLRDSGQGFPAQGHLMQGCVTQPHCQSSDIDADSLAGRDASYVEANNLTLSVKLSKYCFFARRICCQHQSLNGFAA